LKTQLEPEDIQGIAVAVMDLVRPHLSGNDRQSGDMIFNKGSLAEYLHVSESTISQMVMNKQIPHFKIQAGRSGAVRFRQRDIDKWIQRQTIPDINHMTAKTR